jgi:superfamily II DNA or RNA helicase
MTSSIKSPVALAPRVGMLATVRNRRGIITAVEPFDGTPEGRLHLVTVEYTDPDGVADDRLIWEREPEASLLEPTALPDPAQDPPMAADEFDALVRATRWTALSPFVDPDGSDGPLTRLPLASPFHGAIQVDDFQLVPLLKALQMPRVSLLLADDVGLGKTIEAGLILTELLLRRRIRRVLIICPASLKDQWQEEMQAKFSLGFDQIDRDETQALKRRLGLDANPWRTFSRVITSYYYLKQPDVFEQFRAACRVPEGSPHLPWDLLIVDEAHNLAPASFGEDSDLSKLLGYLSPHFEHKLFLTATPHNGHTRSFSGLLERLDPVRFSRRSELSPAERSRIGEVLVRRLKREINERSNPPRFCNRDLAAVPITLSAAEQRLSAAFAEFRVGVQALIKQSRKTEQLAGSFAVEVLGKRLLSCPVAFADSWHRYRQGLNEDEAADANEVNAAKRQADEEIDDDREAEGRRAHVARTVGAWLKPFAAKLDVEMSAIDAALQALALGADTGDAANARPTTDARFDALGRWIDANVRASGHWREDERLVIFTEYKTTLDYLAARLRKQYGDAAGSAVMLLFGGPGCDRRPIIAAFNDPASPVRILIATDAASEGLNLQETARYLLHYDVPWNPARLEQRNGRLDRHGQARDVLIHHFVSDSDADLSFLSYVVKKVESIREDLGSTGEVFDSAFQRRFVAGESSVAVEKEVDETIAKVRGRADLKPYLDTTKDDGADEFRRLEALKAEIDLDPITLRDTLDVALGLHSERPRFEGPDERGRLQLRQPLPTEWRAVIDDDLRLRGDGRHGALPFVVFDPSFYIQIKNGRPIFRPARDTALLHLGHPLFQRALASFARLRFPGAADRATRWTVRHGGVPQGAEALLLITVEELAVNELRESFHHWVQTLRVPIRKGELRDVQPHEPVRVTQASVRPGTRGDMAKARALWDDIAVEAAALVRTIADDLTKRLSEALADEREVAIAREQERFKSRQGELSALIEDQSLARLEREIQDLEHERRQGALFDAEDRLKEILQSQQAKEEELRRRRAHIEDLRRQLVRERERIVDGVLPKRYAIRGTAQVFPVAVEIRLP